MRLDFADRSGKNCLLVACSGSGGNTVALAELLLEHGASAAAFDAKDGTTALHYAAGGGCEGLVRALLSRGASLAARNRRGRTPADEAHSNGHKEVVALLVFPIHLTSKLPHENR